MVFSVFIAFIVGIFLAVQAYVIKCAVLQALKEFDHWKDDQ